MANRRPPWKIPAVIDPPKRRCIQIEIPDNPEHISIFWGVLRGLSDWQRWEQEPTHSATLVAQVWRKVVYAIDWGKMSCCPEPTNQYYDENGILQVSYDNGETYEPATNDPRFNSPLAPPLSTPPGDDLRCEQANNAAGYIKAAADQLAADAAAWSGITTLLAAIGAIVVLLLEIVSAGALTPLLLGLAAALITTGQAAFGAAMTEAVYGELVCIIYCNTPDDGLYTQSDWQAIKGEINSSFTGIARKFLFDNVNAMGTAGLTNAARTGMALGEPCVDCDCPQGCADKYEIHNPMSGHGAIISNDGTTIRIELGDGGNGVGYGEIWSPTLDDCCFLVSVTSVSGNLFGGFHINCGTPYSEANWLVGYGENNCIQLLQIQGDIGAVVDVVFGECP